VTRILGIDPGLANTGLATVEDGRIVGASSIRTKSLQTGAPKMQEILLRGQTIKDTVTDLVYRSCAEYDAVVIEDYKDYGGGYKRSVSYRYTTTPIIVLIYQACQEHGYTPIFQDPEIVMKAFSDYVSAWKASRLGLYPGDNLLTNEHKRSAAAHAIYYYNVARRSL
jgi:hypothetical protein